MNALISKIKAWLGPLWWYSAVMFCAQRVGDVINLFTGLWLVPKWVPPTELGALLPLGQIGGMLGLPLAIILMPFSKYLNTFGARAEYGKVKALLLDALVLASVSSLVIAAYTWVSAPYVFERLRISGTGLVWLLCGVAVTSVFIPILSSTLQSLKLFRCIGVSGLASAPIRLAMLAVFLPISGLLGYFSAQVVSNVASLAISFWGLRKVLSGDVKRESYRGHIIEMFLYMLPVASMMTICGLSTMVQGLVIRQRLPDVESAAFYFASRFSEIPNVLWSAVAVSFFPIVSEAFEKGKNTHRILTQVLFVTVIAGGLVALGLGFVIDGLFGMVNKWKDYQPYAYLVVWMSMTNVFRLAFACYSNHELACRRFKYIGYSIPVNLIESAVLISLTGYGFFVPYFPHSWILWMESIHAARLEFIVGVMFASSAIQFAGILIAIASRSYAQQRALKQTRQLH